MIALKLGRCWGAGLGAGAGTISVACVVALSVVSQLLLPYPSHSMPGVATVPLQPQGQSTLKVEW